MEFNADGSLKLGGAVAKRIEEDAYKMKNTRCVTITKDMTKSTAPKFCTISITASPQLEPNFIERTFAFFSKRVDSNVKLERFSDRECQVIIGNQFSRCRDCQELISSFRIYLDGNVIEKKGNCTFKSNWRSF